MKKFLSLILFASFSMMVSATEQQSSESISVLSGKISILTKEQRAALFPKLVEAKALASGGKLSNELQIALNKLVEEGYSMPRTPVTTTQFNAPRLGRARNKLANQDEQVADSDERNPNSVVPVILLPLTEKNVQQATAGHNDNTDNVVSTSATNKQNLSTNPSSLDPIKNFILKTYPGLSASIVAVIAMIIAYAYYRYTHEKNNDQNQEAIEQDEELATVIDKAKRWIASHQEISLAALCTLTLGVGAGYDVIRYSK